MTQTEAFIHMLKRWGQEAMPKRNAYGDLLFKLAQDAGCDWNTGRAVTENSEEYLRIIDERMYYLVNEHNLAEDLLITGLIGRVTMYLQQTVENQGQNRILLERMLTEMDEIEAASLKLAELKDPGYQNQARLELDTWLKIVAAQCSAYHRMRWEDERYTSNQ
jgi:hypothetical protein